MDDLYILTNDQSNDTFNDASLPGDIYFIANKNTGTCEEITPSSIIQRTTKNLDELKNVIKESMVEALEVELSGMIKESFNAQATLFFNNIKSNLHILNFVGETMVVPAYSNIGDVYKVNGYYCIFYDVNKFVKLFTTDNLEMLLSNFYTKDETDAKLSGVNEELSRVDDVIMSISSKFNDIQADYLTRGEFFNKYTEYSNKLITVKNEYSSELETISSTINSFLTKTKSDSKFFVENTNFNYNSVVKTANDRISALNLTVTNMSSALLEMAELKEKTITLETLVSSLIQTNNNLNTVLENYENTIFALSSQVENLTSQLNELTIEDQEIIE